MEDEEFETMCTNALRMGYVSISASFPEKSKEVLGELSKYVEEGADATEILTKFFLVSIAADGVLAIEEFMLMRPYFEHLAGKPVEFDDAMWMFMDMGLNNIDNFRDALVHMADVYSALPSELRLELVKLCLMIVAADGKITPEEKVWVKQLCAPDPKFDAEYTLHKIVESRQPTGPKYIV